MELFADQDGASAQAESHRAPAHMGTWSYDVDAEQMIWSDPIYSLYDVDRSFKPTLNAMLDLSRPRERPFYDALSSAIYEGEGFTVRYPVMSRSGQTRWLQANGCVYVKDGKPKRILGACRDVTPLVDPSWRPQMRDTAETAAMPDFTDLDGVLRHAGIVPDRIGEGFAMYCFSRIACHDDEEGNLDGEILICDLIDRIGKSVPEAGSIVQIDGDTLAIIAEKVSESEIAGISERLKAVFDQPVEVIDRNLGVCYRFDVFRQPKDMGAEISQALAQANVSAAKAATNLPVVASKRKTWLADEFRQALEADEIVVAYQPKVDFRQGAIDGYEALVRWQHPVKGLLGPSSFQHVFGDPEIENELSNLALEKVVRQLAIWQSAGIDFKSVAVNVTGGQLLEPGFFEWFLKLTEENAVLPSQIKLEIRDDILCFEDDDRLMRTLNWLKEAGFGTAFDDFGRGHAGWKDIVDLSIERLKIDRTLITNLLEDGNKTSLVKSIIELAHDLDLEVIAEGIETVSVHRKLREWGCDVGQGFAYARPMLPRAVPGFISHWKDRQTQAGYMHLAPVPKCG